MAYDPQRLRASNIKEQEIIQIMNDMYIEATKKKQNYAIYTGPVFKYTHGYRYDFVPRLLRIGAGFIEIYRNESHLNAERAKAAPIVKIRTDKVTSVKSITVKAGDPMHKKLPKKQFEEMEKPTDLYKYMIEIQLTENSQLP